MELAGFRMVIIFTSLAISFNHIHLSPVHFLMHPLLVFSQFVSAILFYSTLLSLKRDHTTAIILLFIFIGLHKRKMQQNFGIKNFFDLHLKSAQKRY